jgi:hypothetical protein
MSAFPVPVPNILGHYFSFASIEARIKGQPFVGFTAINYSNGLEPGDVYGTRPQLLGTTRGKQKAEGSLEMYLQDWENLKALLGAGGVGYGEERFSIVVQYGEIGMPVKTDVLEGVRITKVEYSNADGTDAAKVTLTLNIMRVEESGARIDAPIGVGF